MADGRHRRRRSVAQHRSAPAPQRPRPLGIVDSDTGIEHLMTDESVAQGRRAGRYVALCGARVLAASLTTPAERGRCPMCTASAP